jgi:two-component system sensor histidine kinase ChvG
MDQVIHGVNKYNKLALYNLPLSLQILAINFLITFIGFVFLIFFNFFIIKNDDGILQKKINANQNLKNIQSFLEKNAIIRVPLFNDNCTVENFDTCNNENNFELSDPVLEPKITQEYIFNNYLNSDFNIKVYNEDWIRLVDTLDLYDLSIVQEVDLEEGGLEKNNLNFIDNFSQKYLNLFLKYHNYLVKNEFADLITKEKSEISFADLINKEKSDIFYVSESIKDRNLKEYLIQDRYDNLYQYFTVPILSNNKVYGVIILNYPISTQATNLGYVSLNILSFFILFVMIMIFMSLIFSQSLISPIKKLSKLTILERERVNKDIIIYPNRKDEIGVLSKEIQNMSTGLKSQIEQLEKFSADVSHELKNPLTSLQSAIELIDKDSIAKEDKKILIKNVFNDLKRMNQLITDISKFTRLKAEIELEKNQFIDLNKFCDEIPNMFTNNSKQIEILLKKNDENLEVLGNKNKLIQVFINLIENSISLSPKRSKILIELDKVDEKTISFRFYDQGKGINLKDSEKIFDRFYSDRQENIKNYSGLGLSIAREIISHMNGKIFLDKSNKIEYSGACFLITLPVRHST